MRAFRGLRRISHVPVVDFGVFTLGNQSEKQRVSKAVFDAFRDIGFVTLVNHSIPPALMDKTFSASKQFFALQREQKNQYLWTSAESNRGYLGIGEEKLQNGIPDLKETFEIGNEKEQTFPNHWPKELVDFKSTMLEYFAAADSLHLDVLRAIAIGLELDQEYFTPLCDQNHQNLRLLHYPSCKRTEIAESGQKRAGEHTDYGTLTLLAQEDVGGLQAKRRDGEWIFVPPIQNAMVINVGDCMMRWSNDILVSTPHRVIQDPRIEVESIPSRYSIAFFCNPNKSTLIECLPNCSSSENPPKYKPINAFDYLVGRLNDTI